MIPFTFKKATHYITDRLSDLYPGNESTQFARIFFEHHLAFKSTDFITRQNEIIADNFFDLFETTVNRLKLGEPIQYIIGKAWFRDLIFNVNPSVLIPRQETEELVDWIVKDNINRRSSILDIGTGSGCIAIALKNELDSAIVNAWDISEEALKTAESNAQLNQLNVSFECHDILSLDEQLFANKYNVIVSNPPYIKNDEKHKMHINVLNYEPHLALFVDNNDPLVFYCVIAEKSLKMLMPNGTLYFEINEAMGNQTIELLQSLGYINIQLRKDINDKDRMIKATAPN